MILAHLHYRYNDYLRWINRDFDEHYAYKPFKDSMKICIGEIEYVLVYKRKIKKGNRLLVE